MSIDGVCEVVSCDVCSESDGAFTGCVLDRLTGRQTLVETNVECVDSLEAGIHGVVDSDGSDDAKHKLERDSVRRVKVETVMMGVLAAGARQEHRMTMTESLV